MAFFKLNNQGPSQPQKTGLISSYGSTGKVEIEIQESVYRSLIENLEDTCGSLENALYFLEAADICEALLQTEEKEPVKVSFVKCMTTLESLRDSLQEELTLLKKRLKTKKH